MIRFVDSSNILSLAYRKGVMVVTFIGGRVYAYAGVPSHLYATMFRSRSKGKAYNRHIKGAFECVRLA